MTPPTRPHAHQARMILACMIWNKTHTDYRTERDSKCHPGILLLDDKGATVLQPLYPLTLSRLKRLATDRGIDVRNAGCKPL